MKNCFIFFCVLIATVLGYSDDYDMATCRVETVTTLVPAAVVTNTVTTLVPAAVVTNTVTTLVPAAVVTNTVNVTSTITLPPTATFIPAYTALGCHVYNSANDATNFLVKREISQPPNTPDADYAYTYNECANTCALAPNQHFTYFSVADAQIGTPVHGALFPLSTSDVYVCSCYNLRIASSPITGCTITLAIPVSGTTDYTYGLYQTDENLFQITP
jgi:hypothetical protein